MVQKIYHKHSHAFTGGDYTPEGGVASHAHDTAHAACGATSAAYGTATAITSTSVAPAFTGTAKAPTGTISSELA